MDCIFCEIIAGRIPTRKVYEDDNVLAIYDIKPQAPIHVVIMTKSHIPSAAQITHENVSAVSSIFTAVPKIAAKLGITSYRIINNCGPDAGQTVAHLHFHLLAGKQFGETL